MKYTYIFSYNIVHYLLYDNNLYIFVYVFCVCFCELLIT